jgi:hypothetical protein
MAEPAIETPVATEPQVEKTSRLKSFRVNHPRTARVVGIAAGAVAVLGVVNYVKNRKQAADSSEAGGNDVSFDVSSETN